MNTLQELKVPLRLAIGEYGSAAQLAQALGVSKGAVSQYRAKGEIPQSKAYLFALLWLGRHWHEKHNGETVGTFFARELVKSSPVHILCPFLCDEKKGT